MSSSFLSGAFSGAVAGSVGGPAGIVVGGIMGGVLAQHAENEQRSAARSADQNRKRRIQNAANAEMLLSRQNESLRSSSVNMGAQQVSTNALPSGSTPTQAVGNMGAISSAGTF